MDRSMPTTRQTQHLSIVLAVHITHSDGLTGASPAALATQRQLVGALGSTYHQVIGDDGPDVLLEFARVDVPDDLPEPLTDPGLLERAIANLVGSAVRQVPRMSCASTAPLRSSADGGGRRVLPPRNRSVRSLPERSRWRRSHPPERYRRLAIALTSS
jgi:hypothetical protein